MKLKEYGLPEGFSLDHKIQQYMDNGRIPWSDGYKPYRNTLLKWAMNSSEVYDTFRGQKELPEGWGYGIDERIVEYPWFFSRLDQRDGILLDAGSTMNIPFLLDLPVLSRKTILIMTLTPEHFEKRTNVSYLFGDLRNMLIRDESCDWIVSISTIEHIGMDNTQLYTSDDRFRESCCQSYIQALLEMKRVLKPRGRLFITVPYGQYQQLKWLQQFDYTYIQQLKKALDIRCIEETYYRYHSTGWKLSNSDECRNCEYYDVHATPEPQPDRAAAARAVACLQFEK